MPKDDSEILADAHQHAQRCPGCLGTNVHLVPGGHMGCDSCGHVWVGKDFTQEDSETPLPGFPVEPDKS